MHVSLADVQNMLENMAIKFPYKGRKTDVPQL